MQRRESSGTGTRRCIIQGAGRTGKENKENPNPIGKIPFGTYTYTHPLSGCRTRSLPCCLSLCSLASLSSSWNYPRVHSLCGRPTGSATLVRERRLTTIGVECKLAESTLTINRLVKYKEGNVHYIS
ncbi:hypothetical protein GWI33_021133 [Rhynchophorus ferrugineus]|uniref:Uncharacterized protein n=1 Tax=Rhynchophorus ferrugineus TaxID=354439 RepID=A0A834HPH3_RHYFE|nr:hypothetical protein GWI33_021133 [Rhynchophorus ferrugineus]